MKLKDLIKKYGEQEISMEQEQVITKQLGIKTAWKPTFGETYWFIIDTGIIGAANWVPSVYDDLRYKLGNCFRTADDAKFAYQKLLVTAELKRFMEEHNEKIDYGSDEPVTIYNLICGFHDGERIVSFIPLNVWLLDKIYFTDAQIARDAIEAIGEDRLIKYYFGIENK